MNQPLGAETNGEAPAMLLLRADLKRHWSRENLRVVARVIGVVFAIQLAVGWALARTLPALGPTNWSLLTYVAGMLGLHGSWSTTFLQACGFVPSPVAAPHSLAITWIVVTSGILGMVVQILLPAFAALSVAPDRENGRMEELLLAGFRPLRILIAKGAAAVLPLLALWLVGRLFTDGAMLVATGNTTLITLPFAVLPWPVLFLLSLVSLLTRAGILVCVSALCGRHRSALVGCYAAAFFLLPVLSLVLLSPFQLMGLHFSQWWLPYHFIPVAFQIIVFAALLPRALAALTHPEDHGPSDQSRKVNVRVCV